MPAGFQKDDSRISSDGASAAPLPGDRPEGADTALAAMSAACLRALRYPLRLSLFHKLLWANVLVVTAGLLLGMGLWARVVGASGGDPVAGAFLLVLAGAATACVLVNWWLLRVALRPLRLLEDSASKIREQGASVHVPVSGIADPDLEKLASTFNSMLDDISLYRQRTQVVSARALSTAEEERKRIARELHDETAQRLAALLIRLRLARCATDPDRRDLLMDELREGLTEVLEGVRRFARGLRPPALDELGLIAAMESYAREVSEAGNLTVDISHKGLPCQLPAETELALYRIVQEALTNVSRHSEADHAQVELRCETDCVVALVEDDGRGFQLADVVVAGGALGLMGMQERAGYLGGRVTIDSRPGVGTRVIATLPSGCRCGEQHG